VTVVVVCVALLGVVKAAAVRLFRFVWCDRSSIFVEDGVYMARRERPYAEDLGITNREASWELAYVRSRQLLEQV
jgi:hypothetical protein